MLIWRVNISLMIYRWSSNRMYFLVKQMKHKTNTPVEGHDLFLFTCCIMTSLYFHIVCVIINTVHPCAQGSQCTGQMIVPNWDCFPLRLPFCLVITILLQADVASYLFCTEFWICGGQTCIHMDPFEVTLWKITVVTELLNKPFMPRFVNLSVCLGLFGGFSQELIFVTPLGTIVSAGALFRHRNDVGVLMKFHASNSKLLQITHLMCSYECWLDLLYKYISFFQAYWKFIFFYFQVYHKKACMFFPLVVILLFIILVVILANSLIS